MDDGGEVRLARRKGKKRPPSAVAAAPADREGDAEGGAGASRGREWDKFHALWRDYHDLLKETKAKKRRLESMNQRKLGLFAEVKFLRKKYSSFLEDDSQQTHHKLKKKKARQIPSPLGSNDSSVFAYHEATGEVPSTSKNAKLDLNQDSVMNDEGAGCQGFQDHSELGKLDRAGVDEDIMTPDVNLSVCDDKRTIAWQYRVALKCFVKKQLIRIPILRVTVHAPEIQIV